MARQTELAKRRQQQKIRGPFVQQKPHGCEYCHQKIERGQEAWFVGRYKFHAACKDGYLVKEAKRIANATAPKVADEGGKAGSIHGRDGRVIRAQRG
jgi:hypothetical protein